MDAQINIVKHLPSLKQYSLGPTLWEILSLRFVTLLSPLSIIEY